MTGLNTKQTTPYDVCSQIDDKLLPLYVNKINDC